MTKTSILVLAGSVALTSARCFEPEPAFPVPQWQKSGPWIPASAYSPIAGEVDRIDKDLLASSSYSIEVTSGDETLWTKYHTASQLDDTRPGVANVDGDSQYRIASITKVFTTLGLLYQHDAGNVSLDTAIDNYVPELQSSDSGEIPWKDITLRILASQLSGLPRDFAIGMVIGRLEDEDLTDIGLPPLTHNDTLACPGGVHSGTCTRSDLLRALKQQKPIFAPNQKSTYSNDAFELLGLALENATGRDYSEYITEAILKPLNMSSTSFETPSDDHAVLTRGQSAIWDVEEGVQRPTGGLYASAGDLSKFLRYILRHYNAIATGVNWLLPASWSTEIHTFYGMPWEILRSNTVLEHSKRAVTIVTKSGGLPGYTSQILLLPEYDLGVTILVAGNGTLLEELRDIVLPGLIRAAEAAVWNHIANGYTKDMVTTSPHLNSSLSLEASPSRGLAIKSFISNGTDVLNTVIPRFLGLSLIPGSGSSWHAQLVPTLLFKDEKLQEGEIWRMVVVENRVEKQSAHRLFDDFCLTDVDTTEYGGLPLNEVVFWHEVGLVELPAFRVKFKAAAQGEMPGLLWSSALRNLVQQVIG